MADEGDDHLGWTGAAATLRAQPCPAGEADGRSRRPRTWTVGPPVRRLLARYRRPRAPPASSTATADGRRPTASTRWLRARLVELATTTYAGVNRAHLADLLAEREDLALSRSADAAPVPRRGRCPGRSAPPPRGHRTAPRADGPGRAAPPGRRQPPRLARGRGPWLTLVGAIDDATGIVTGATSASRRTPRATSRRSSRRPQRYGLPVGLYSDRHGIFWKSAGAVPTLAEQFAGRRSTTQLGRALEAAAIAWVAARSPQAKGRVERLWGTAQDRLVAELGLAGARTIEEANAVLAAWLPRHNARFAVAGRRSEPGLASAARGARAGVALLLPAAAAAGARRDPRGRRTEPRARRPPGRARRPTLGRPPASARQLARRRDRRCRPWPAGGSAAASRPAHATRRSTAARPAAPCTRPSMAQA